MRTIDMTTATYTNNVSTFIITFEFEGNRFNREITATSYSNAIIVAEKICRDFTASTIDFLTNEKQVLDYTSIVKK